MYFVLNIFLLHCSWTCMHQHFKKESLINILSLSQLFLCHNYMLTSYKKRFFWEGTWYLFLLIIFTPASGLLWVCIFVLAGPSQSITMLHQEGELKVCPYNPSHLIRSKRMITHLNKCRKNYLSLGYKICPMDATHHVPPEQFEVNSNFTICSILICIYYILVELSCTFCLYLHRSKDLFY